MLRIALPSLLLIASCSDSALPPAATGALPSLAVVPTVEICDATVGAAGASLTFETTACFDCVIEAAPQAADGAFDSVALVRFAASLLGAIGTLRVRATAASGTVFPPGYAGVFLGQPLNAQGLRIGAQISRSVQTYLAGALQETSLPSAEGPNIGVTQPEQFSLLGLKATKPFDAVELTYQWRGVTEPAALRISEFCHASRVAEGAFLDAPPRTPRPSSAAAPEADGLHRIDLLLLYTPRYLHALGSVAAVEQALAATVARANTLFANSGIAARYEIKSMQAYSGVSETLPTAVALNVLQADALVQQHRDRVGGDLTVLIATRDLGANLCGKAALFNGGMQSDTANAVDAVSDSVAIVHLGAGQFREGCNATTFAHELGHLLGGGHEATADDGAAVGAYWKPYAHGWTCGTRTDGRKQATVMSSDGALIADAEVFSSPRLTRGGEPCGQVGAADDEATQADNVRAISEAIPHVAAYR